MEEILSREVTEPDDYPWCSTTTRAGSTLLHEVLAVKNTSEGTMLLLRRHGWSDNNIIAPFLTTSWTKLTATRPLLTVKWVSHSAKKTLLANGRWKPQATDTYFVGYGFDAWIDPSVLMLHGQGLTPLPVVHKDTTLKAIRKRLTATPEPSRALLEWDRIIDWNWSDMKAVLNTNLVTRKQASLVWRIAHQTEWTGEQQLRADIEKGKTKQETLMQRATYACPHCRRGNARPTETWIHLIYECPVAEHIWLRVEQVMVVAHDLGTPSSAAHALFGPAHNPTLPRGYRRNRPAFRLLMTLYHLARWTIWRLRCLAKFDSLDATPELATAMFDKLVSNRAYEDLTLRRTEAMQMWGACAKETATGKFVFELELHDAAASGAY